MRKLNSNFIERLQLVQPDLSLSGDYLNMSTPVEVMDKLGIRYKCSPNNLLRGIKPTILTAVDKTDCFRKLGSNRYNNKFDYSNVIYTTSKTKVSIICPIHGEFLQTPTQHLIRKDCPQCSAMNFGLNQTYTNEEFIKRASIVHNNKYDYSLTKYTNNKNKIQIICPIHGEFSQTANDHVRGSGCIKCQNKNKLNIDKVVNYNKSKSPYTYTYPEQEIKDKSQKIKVLCSVHGEFEQNLESHLKGAICPKCRKQLKALNYTDKFKKIFIQKAVEKHGNKYNYDNTDYINANIKVKIKCNQCKQTFEQTPQIHLKGSGCPKCNQIGYRKYTWINHCKKDNTFPKVYIIRCYNNNENFIKIGLTSTSVNKRFYNCLPYSYEILKEIKGSPDFVWDKEKELHKLCKPFKYKPLKPFAGETECFTLNCLSLLSL